MRVLRYSSRGRRFGAAFLVLGCCAVLAVLGASSFAYADVGSDGERGPSGEDVSSDAHTGPETRPQPPATYETVPTSGLGASGCSTTAPWSGALWVVCAGFALAFSGRRRWTTVATADGRARAFASPAAP